MSKPWSARGKGLHVVGPILLGAVLLLIVNAGGGSKGGLSLGGVAWQFSVTMVKSAPGLAILGGAMWLFNRGRLIMPNDLGMVPLDKKDAKAVAVTLVTEAQAIQKQGVTNDGQWPASVTHLSINESRAPTGPPPAPPKPIIVPSFAQLREANSFKPEEFYIGESSEGPRTIVWKRDGSGVVASKMGGGKSTLMVSAAVQMLEAGGRVILLDIHAGNPDSLFNRMGGGQDKDTLALIPGGIADEKVLGAPLGTDERSVRELMEWQYAELRTAIDQKLPTQPTLILLDEGNAVAGRPELRKAFGKLAHIMTEESRKFDYGLFIAVQRATEQDTGKDGIMARTGWSIVGRLKYLDVPRALGVDSTLCPKDTEMLPAGAFYMVDRQSGQVIRVQVPMVTGMDLAAVRANRLGLEQVSGVQVLNGHTSEELVTTQPLALVEDVDWRPGDPDKIPVARYRELHSQGLSNRAVLEECWGEGVGGRKYTRELKNLREATASCTCGSDLHKEKVSV